MNKEKKRMPTVKNRKAYHEFHILEKYEAGIALLGCEVKSIRNGRVNFADSYVRINEGEAFVVNMHVTPYDKASQVLDPTRSRKLLLHKKQLITLGIQMKQKGFTIVPIELYFKRGRVKLMIALAKGKRQFDKREKIRRKTTEREIARAIKRQ